MTKLPEKIKRHEQHCFDITDCTCGFNETNAMHAQWTALIEDGTLCVMPGRDLMAEWLQMKYGVSGHSYDDLNDFYKAAWLKDADAIIAMLKSQSIKEKGE